MQCIPLPQASATRLPRTASQFVAANRQVTNRQSHRGLQDPGRYRKGNRVGDRHLLSSSTNELLKIFGVPNLRVFMPTRFLLSHSHGHGVWVKSNLFFNCIDMLILSWYFYMVSMTMLILCSSCLEVYCNTCMHACTHTLEHIYTQLQR